MRSALMCILSSAVIMASVLRKRGVREETEGEVSIVEDKKASKASDPSTVSLKELSFVVLCIVGLIAIAVLPHYHLPRPKKDKRSKEGRFTAEKARSYLEGITEIGHRTVGSYRNDVVTVDYLLKQIYFIISHTHVHYHVDVEVQTASGGFMLHFLHKQFAVAYENITNIIVHLYPKNAKDLETNILVNAHFDTQPRTEGASDDAVSCAIMLESMRAITRSPPRTIKQGIVFLFNGAEEGILEGSHAFVTQHRLASTIKAFVNLEAAGSGGREVVFQTGPGHPWLINTYASNAKYPFASIMGQEIFQSGIIPSDTDFRIFRDYGGLVGIDIAYASNGYVYHTRHDNASIIPDGSIQRGGENVLAVLKALSKSPYLSHPEDYKHGKVVFFDVLGLFMVIFPQKMETILNYGCCIASIVYIFMQLRKKSYDTGSKKEITPPNPTVFMIIISMGSVILSWTSAILVAVLEAFIITKLGKSLSWYSHPLFAIMLYGMPALCTILFVHHSTRHAAKKFGIHCGSDEVEQTAYAKNCILAHLLIISILVALMTYKGILSTFMLTLYLLFPLIFHGIIGIIVLKDENDDLYSTKLIGIHIIAVAVPVVVVIYHLFSIFDVFVPIMGRQGSEIPPDVVLAVISSFCIIMVTLYLVSLIYKVANAFLVIKFTGIVSCISFLFAVSGIMFPYSGDHPVSPKRIFLQHVVRNFHNADGRVYKNDSGIWFAPLDYLGLQPVMHLPSLKDVARTECDGPYCGYPYFFPLRKLLRKTWYLKGPRPFASKKKLVAFKLVKKEPLVDNIVRYHFKVKGPDHMSLLVTPNNENRLVKWSITKEPPMGQEDYDGRVTFYTYFAHGFYAKPWEFWLDFEVNAEAEDGSICDIAVAGHFLHGPLSMTKWMQKIIGEFPPWVVDVAFVSSYDAWRM